MSYTEYKVKVYKDGTEKWFNSDDQFHREDGPAVVLTDGYKVWYKNGKRHREDGPAVVCAHGSKHWYKNGKRHREDGPASVFSNDHREWWKNGLRHREAGPAVILPGGSKAWFLNGIEYTEQEFHKEMAKRSDPCDGKTVEIDGKKYKLSLVD